MYRHLSVDVGEDTDLDKWTVKRSLKQFFQPEKRELKCEKCSEGKTATQKMEIISWSVSRALLPFLLFTAQVLVEAWALYFQRFSSYHILTIFITHSPKALLLHFKRFIVTQEVKGSTRVRGYSDGKENEAAPPQPRMEMVLRKNKVRLHYLVNIS